SPMANMTSLTENGRLNRPFSVRDVILAIGEGAVALSNADRLAVYIRGKDDGAFCAWSHGLSANYIEQVTSYVDRLPARRLWKDPVPILISDTEELLRDRYQWVQVLTRMEGIRAFALWPLVYEGRMIATVACYYNAPRTWSRAEWEVMATFIRQAAVALQNARLYDEMRRINEKLQESMRAREELTRNAWDELRTPLSLIKGYVELLQSGRLDIGTATYQEIVAGIEEQHDRLLSMVDRMLTLQALSARDLKKVPVDVAPFFEQAVRAWREKAAHAGISLRLSVEDGLPALVIDPERMRQLMDELLDNALKFSSHGGTVRVRVWRSENDLRISVSDEGVGIPPGELDRVFDLYQVEGGAARRFGGMGVGLRLCRRIVEAHGGCIWAESEGEGQGSTFHVSVPFMGISVVGDD
ncbi:MAG: HAMP domain-containing histidine kinase, partial [Anaerolineae bacterium]|nr:HAMP domain-containing histidine kinase [Anaerolineae bacterium]